MTDLDGVIVLRIQPQTIISGRRCIFFLLVIAAIGLMTTEFIGVFSGIAFSFLYAALLATFAVNVAWTAFAFCNALIGFVVLCRSNNRVAVSSPLQRPGGGVPLTARTAVVMTICNDKPAEVFARLRSIQKSLDQTSSADTFDYFVLSDSSLPDVIEDEHRAFEAWQAGLPDAARVTYRRRPVNEGFKPGNLRDFCARWGQNYTFMLLLDADSLMTGETVVRLVRMMQNRPELGILQSVIVGVLNPSFFARVFEFGHRHALRCSIVGSEWWQADRCQFWGHNAVIRLAPFSQYCEMPYLPGKGPFSGHIICHDQIEASFMHRAGYEVRVLPQECGSYEGIPPTVLEFMKRNHRWCQGNLKNLKVAGAPGLAGMDRFHLCVVAQRFIAWPALVVFVLLAAIETRLWPADAAFPAAAAVGLYILWLAMFFAPKLLGIVNAILDPASRYGSGPRLILCGFVEFVFTVLLTPATMVGATNFMISSLFDRRLVWGAQRRQGYSLSWRDAWASLWLETLIGLALFAFLAATNMSAVVWFAPFWLGLVVAVPFAVVTSLPEAERWAIRWQVCSFPEEIDPPTEIRDALLMMSEAAGANSHLAETGRGA
jgi:membrane glycosyltransferase